MSVIESLSQVKNHQIHGEKKRFHFYCIYDSIERDFDTLELSILFDVCWMIALIHNSLNYCKREVKEEEDIIVGKQTINEDDGWKQILEPL